MFPWNYSSAAMQKIYCYEAKLLKKKFVKYDKEAITGSETDPDTVDGANNDR